MAIGASAPLIRGAPGIQGPHHREGSGSTGAGSVPPALVQPGRVASGKPDGPLSSVNPGEGPWGHSRSPVPLRIRLGSGFSLATGATGITPQGRVTGQLGKLARIPWILVIPDPGESRVPMKPGIPGSGIPVGSRNLGRSPARAPPPHICTGLSELFGSTVRSWITYYDL